MNKIGPILIFFLGKIINITESEGAEPRPIPLQASQPEITPGETEISVTISLSYEIR